MAQETSPLTTEPSPPSTESPSPAPLDADVEFDGGGRDFDEASVFADLDEVPPAAAPAEPAQAKAPPPTPSQVEPPAPTPPSTPQQEAEVTPEQVLEAFRGWRSNAEAVLSNSHYN